MENLHNGNRLRNHISMVKSNLACDYCVKNKQYASNYNSILDIFQDIMKKYGNAIETSNAVG